MTAPDLVRALPEGPVALLRRLGAIAGERRQDCWLVGGLVRDCLLGVGNVDLDVVVEGDGPAFARRAAAALGAGVETYDRFLTATLTLPDLTRVDIATARAETYERAGALPTVRPSTIADDLRRRDVTINAMAMALMPDRFGELLDPHGGAADAAAGVLRVLHPRSFLDDPTRILRLARFAARFGFAPEPATARWLEEALAARVFDFLSADRLRHDLYLVLFEPEPGEALARLAAWGALAPVVPGAAPGGDFPALADQARALVALTERGPEWDPAVLGLMLLLREASPDDLATVVRRLNITASAREAVLAVPRLPHLVRLADEAQRLSVLHGELRDLPLEVLLAVLVLLPGESSRKRLMLYLRRGRKLRPELSGDDLMAMGFAEGPGLKRILDALLEEKMDGRLDTRKGEEAYVREHFQPPHGDALS